MGVFDRPKRGDRGAMRGPSLRRSASPELGRTEVMGVQADRADRRRVAASQVSASPRRV